MNHNPLLGLGHETMNDIDVLVQERRNSIAHAPESRLSCTNPSICGVCLTMLVWNNLLRISSNPKSNDCPKQDRSLQTIETLLGMWLFIDAGIKVKPLNLAAIEHE